MRVGARKDSARARASATAWASWSRWWSLSDARCVYDFLYVAPPPAFPAGRRRSGARAEPRGGAADARARAARGRPRRRRVVRRPRAAHVQVARNLALPPSYLELVARQIDIIGVRSTAVALVAALFTGMVLALQTAVNMARFGAEGYVGPVVALSILRELGPVLTAILSAARSPPASPPSWARCRSPSRSTRCGRSASTT